MQSDPCDSDRVKRFMSQPLARRWCYSEFFYSTIDRVLFLADNEFESCMQKLFPRLKGYMFDRVQWSLIKRYIGRPRRCSAKYFRQEREQLEMRRQKLRLLQRRLVHEGRLREFDDLPEMIPEVLVVGSKVIAKLGEPWDGLFPGCVTATDFDANAYRIVFDDPALGTKTVSDTDVTLFDSPMCHKKQDYFLKKRLWKYRQSPSPSNSISRDFNNECPKAFQFSGESSDDDVSLDDYSTINAVECQNTSASNIIPIVRFSRQLMVASFCLDQLRAINDHWQYEISRNSQAVSESLSSRHSKCLARLEVCRSRLSELRTPLQSVYNKIATNNGLELLDDPDDTFSEARRKKANTLTESAMNQVKEEMNKISQPDREHITKVTSDLVSLCLNMKEIAHRCGGFVSQLSAVKEAADNMCKEICEDDSGDLQTTLQSHISKILDCLEKQVLIS